MTYQLLTVRSAEMYLVPIACQVLLVSIISANPFHKYPYVFLLDIGNEELEKTNSEQIRVSMPGGSLALRYPAFEDGDTITHVRVSGIDFETDLKVNIVDGGPGSKYVIIVFTGNKGKPYDAILTIQTISDEDMNNNPNNTDGSNEIEDSNDSAEDTSDVSTDFNTKDVSKSDSQGAGNTNAEIRQPIKYPYAIDESETENRDDISKPSFNAENNRNNDHENTNKDENIANNEENHRKNSEISQDTEINDELDEYDSQEDKNEEESDANDRKSEPSQIGPEHSDFNDDYGNDESAKADNPGNISKYTKYQPPLIPKLYGGLKIYPQNAVPLIRSDSENSVFNSEDPNEVDQTFNDEELHNYNNNKVRNKNYYIDTNDASAVES